MKTVKLLDCLASRLKKNIVQIQSRVLKVQSRDRATKVGLSVGNLKLM
jgi:hypothetical protein